MGQPEPIQECIASEQRDGSTASVPFLVGATHPRSSAGRHSLIGLWHLCSLDAPSVAALWAYFIAHCSGVSLPWTASVSMFLAVWMLYVADRLLDARNAATGSDMLEERHLFHHRYRKQFLCGLLICSFALAILLVRLTHVEFRLFSALGSLLFGYFFLIHIWPGTVDPHAGSHRLPKEFAVGIFFAAAVFIPTVARAPTQRASLLPAAIMFALVCTLNCLYVYAWEHPFDCAGAHWATRFAVRHTRSAVTLSLAACCVLLALPITTASAALITASCAVSLVCFGLLDQFRSHFTALDLRACVDLALLAPLPIVVLLGSVQR